MVRPKEFERAEVLDKAIEVFWRKGFADTSLHDLEVSTGVNKSGLYSEFKDKDDIFAQSLKRYRETNPALAILERTPLGRKNLEDFLLAGQNCSGLRGCFIANSVREISILSPSAKRQILQHIELVRAAVLQNVKAATSSSNSAAIADIMMVYSSGLALQANLAADRDSSFQTQMLLQSLLGQ